MTVTEKFYKECMVNLEYALEASGDKGNTKELLFTSRIVEDLSEGNNPVFSGFTGDPFRYAPPALDYHIDGYSMSDEENSIFLYVTDFVDSPDPFYRNLSDVEKHLKGVHEFVKSCISNPEKLLNQTIDLPVYELVFQYSHNYSQYSDINYVYLTNGLVREVKLPVYKIFGKNVNIIIMDIERYRRFMDGQTIRNIDADLNILESPIECVSACDLNEDYDTYCFLLSGRVIFNLFDVYHYQLLNSNVRTYLQLRGKINQGIMETIRDNPGNFLAYNNGISAIASSVDLDEMGRIVALHDFQIVNGGQTSASIYNAVGKGYNVNKIRVLVKLTIINNSTHRDEIIRSISRYANTQNVIKFSDFSSNDFYNKELAILSRSVITPSINSSIPTKWYYENVSGAYNIERADRGKIFEKEYPVKQMFTKTDLAAYELSYQGLPAIACRGAQDAYKVFVMNLPNFKKPNAEDFKRIVAKKILFDQTMEILDEQGGQGKKSVAKYVVAYISTVICGNKMNLDLIWNNQQIGDGLKKDISTLVNQMTPLLRKEATKNNKSLEMYCRMPTTWQRYKNRIFKVEHQNEYIGEEEIFPVLTSRRVPSCLVTILRLMSKENWMKMAGNCNAISRDTTSAKKNSSMCITMASTDLVQLSERQIAYALRIIYSFYKKNMCLDDNIQHHIIANQDDFEKLATINYNSFSKEKYFYENDTYYQ